MLDEAIKRGTRQEPDPSWYRYMWLNLDTLSRKLLSHEQELVSVQYFTAPISGNKGKQERQNAYLDALRTIPSIKITFGRFQPDRKECDKCGHPAYHPQEKKTDVNIATGLILDAIEDRYDTAILMSGDSDLTPAIHAVRKLRPEKRIVIAFPPNRLSVELELATGRKSLRIWESHLRQSRLPDLIRRDGLPDIASPAKYSGLTGCTRKQ
jgi:uncharacterized LabA/DUF88 family protein